MKNDLPPPPVLPDSRAMELMRIWLIDGVPNFVITPNKWNDPSAWGLLLADILRQLGKAYEADGRNGAEVIARIKEVFDVEWATPTSGGNHA